jgi:hypothetical protein
VQGTGEPVSRPGANAEDAERANRPSPDSRIDRGEAGLEVPPSRWHEANTDYADNCTPVVP